MKKSEKRELKKEIKEMNNLKVDNVYKKTLKILEKIDAEMKEEKNSDNK